MPRLLLLAALAGLLACASAAPRPFSACASHQDRYYEIDGNEYQDTAAKNFVQRAFNKLEPWLAKRLMRKSDLMAGCTFDEAVLEAAPTSEACYKTVAYAAGKPAKGQYGFESFELDFMCPEALNGPATVQVLKHIQCSAIVYTNRDGSWWKTPDYSCQ